MAAHLGILNLLAQADDSGPPSAWDQLWFGGHTETSTFAAGTDAVFFYIFWVSAFFFVLLMWLMVYWAFKYRRVPGRPAEPSPSHNTPLEITWSVVPTILLAIMFFWGFYEYLPTRIAPANSEQVRVVGQQWLWTIEYDNGATPLETTTIADNAGPVFALPVDHPTKFTMTSKDVIHSFYIPAFRAKRDVFPNMYTHMWVQPTKISHRYVAETDSFEPLSEHNKGYYAACTEYCGDQHSQMWGLCMVLSRDDFQIWKDKQADTINIDPGELGELLYAAKGCISCHSLDGSRGTGPTWRGIWGKQETMKSGEVVTVDENYIRESILEPAAKIVESYPNQMQSYQGQLTERELFALIRFIQRQSENQSDIDEADRLIQELRDEEAAAAEADEAAGG